MPLDRFGEDLGLLLLVLIERGQLGGGIEGVCVRSGKEGGDLLARKAVGLCGGVFDIRIAREAEEELIGLRLVEQEGDPEVAFVAQRIGQRVDQLRLFGHVGEDLPDPGGARVVFVVEPVGHAVAVGDLDIVRLGPDAYDVAEGEGVIPLFVGEEQASRVRPRHAL